MRLGSCGDLQEEGGEKSCLPASSDNRPDGLWVRGGGVGVEPSLDCQQVVEVLGLGWAGLGSTAKLASFKVGRSGAGDDAEEEEEEESGSTANLARRIPSPAETDWLLLPGTCGLFRENGWTVATFRGRTPCSMTQSSTLSITVLAASPPEPTEASSRPRSGNSVG